MQEVSNIDVDEYRNMVSDLSSLPLFDEKCCFYYDETGNVRKFRLTEKGVNAEEGIINDFILGGVLFKGDIPPCDVEKLFDGLNVSSQDAKFKTLAGRGADIWIAIGKKPIQQYLSWLDSSGLYIHFTALNNIYYSVVDIVDSLFATQPQYNFGYEWVQALKASLHRFVLTNIEDVLPMLYSYNYPSLIKDDIKDFCFDLSNLIQSYGDEDFYLENFRQLLKANGRKGELIFIEGNTPGLLVEEKLTGLETAFDKYVEDNDIFQEINDNFLNEDKVLKLMEELIKSDKLMKEISVVEIYEICEKGKNQYKDKTPPRFMDDKDKDGVDKYNDLIIWNEVIKYSKGSVYT